jgi:hypothetical protein
MHWGCLVRVLVVVVGFVFVVVVVFVGGGVCW